jgi:hypothetical protein
MAMGGNIGQPAATMAKKRGGDRVMEVHMDARGYTKLGMSMGTRHPFTRG